MNHPSPDGRILWPVGHLGQRLGSTIDTRGNSGPEFYSIHSILISLFNSPQLFLNNIALVIAVTIHAVTSG